MAVQELFRRQMRRQKREVDLHNVHGGRTNCRESGDFVVACGTIGEILSHFRLFGTPYKPSNAPSDWKKRLEKFSALRK